MNWRLLLLPVILTLSPAMAQPRHLFLDPAILKETKGAELRVNPPSRSEIVIRADKPWEQLMISFFLTVREEEGKLRMWYICRDAKNQPNVAYAESTDGLNWTKPNLGIVDHEGSTANNLVGMTSLEGVVLPDPQAPAEQRYSYITHVFGEGIVRFHSPDGLQWNRDPTPLSKFGADNQLVTFREKDHFVFYLRGWEKREDGKRYRTVVRTTSPDLTTPWPPQPTETSLHIWGPDNPPIIVDELPTVFETDNQDAPNSDVYTIGAQPYPPDPTWYVGFPSLFQREEKISVGRTEIQCIGSRDGIVWHRYDRAPYVSPGPDGSENCNMVYMGTGMVVRGDEIWQYGTGFRSKHGDMEARRKRTDGTIYRHVQRLDGFVSLDFDSAGGTATTIPIEAGPALFVNVDTGALGHLKAAWIDENGQALEESDVVRINSTRAQVTWQGNSDLSKLAGRKLSLRFTGSRAKLYSFYFANPS